jgi:hypothetical protein
MRTISFLLLSACIPAETGIDHTILTGTLTIPPATVDDARSNNEIGAAQGLGPDDASSLTYRTVVVNGKITSWRQGLAEGDPDYFAFTPVKDGTFSFDLAFDTAAAGEGDTAGAADADILTVSILDPATYDADAGTGVLWSSTTDGSLGAFAFEYDVTGGTEYVLLIEPTATDDTDAELPYTLVLSGSAPEDETVLVGAYLGTDPSVAENPMGGTNATDWVYDPDTMTWSGAWKIMYVRSVTAVEDTDPSDLFLPTPTVEEGPATVFVRAATLTSLNAGPAAGALYTTTSVEVAVTGAEQVVETPLVLDGVAPKVIGVQAAETLPDETLAEIDLADNSLIAETLVAQDLGMLSGLGYVDVITGSSLHDPAASGWNGTNDSDAFAFTVPELLGVRMVASWADSATDIDFGIWYADPDYGLIDLFSSWGSTYCMSAANPEVCESEIVLEPETTYYLLALGYLGTDDEPYTIELEWVAP